MKGWAEVMNGSISSQFLVFRTFWEGSKPSQWSRVVDINFKPTRHLALSSNLLFGTDNNQPVVCTGSTCTVTSPPVHGDASHKAVLKSQLCRKELLSKESEERYWGRAEILGLWLNIFLPWQKGMKVLEKYSVKGNFRNKRPNWVVQWFW